MPLEPNKPIGRLRYIEKQYGDRDSLYLLGAYNEDREDMNLDPRPGFAPPLRRMYDKTMFRSDGHRVLYDTIDVAYHLTGADEVKFRRSVRDASVKHPSTVDEHADDFFKLLLDLADEDLPARDEYDFILPWAARELWRFVKSLKKGTAAPWPDQTGSRWEIYKSAVDELVERSRAIAQWSKTSGVDIMRLNLAEALDEIRDFKVEGSVEPGEVIYTFDDGWTIQILSPECVDDEGHVMQHCVGGYAGEIEKGRAMILSLRSPSGSPHVTMELTPLSKFTGERRANTEGPGWHAAHYSALAALLREGHEVPPHQAKFVQIMGKQNREPDDKYKTYLAQFFADRFPGFVRARLSVVAKGEKLDMRGERVTDVDFSSRQSMLPYHIQYGLWEGAFFTNCIFGYLGPIGLVGEGAQMPGATFLGCLFKGNLFNTNLRGIEAERCNWTPACVVDDTDMSSSVFRGCALPGVRFTGTDLRGTKFIESWLPRASFEWSQMEGVEFYGLDTSQDHVDVVDGVDLRSIDPEQLLILLGRKNRLQPLMLTDEQVKTLMWLDVGEVPAQPGFHYYLGYNVSMGDISRLVKEGVIGEDDVVLIHKWARSALSS